MQSKIPAPIGQLVDVGGHRLHIYTAGQGSPTVVFESGGAGWSLDWYPVLTEVAKFTRACTYDRAGFGWSEAGPNPRTSQQIIEELHALLVNAAIQPPFVMVGASFGGHTARLYASRYPAEVAGIILLDARHEDIDAKMPPAWNKLQKNGRGMYQFMLAASRIGLLNILGKLAGEKAAPPFVQELPDEIRSLYLPVGFQPKYFEANLAELAAAAESDRHLRATGAFGNLPLTVIRHGIPDLFERMPAAQADKAEEVWQALQSELSKLSTNSHLLVAEQSGHRIQNDQPDLVVDAIRQMVASIRIV